MISNCFMSKRKATNESEKKCPKKKKTSLTGFSKEETPNRIKNMENITFW